MVFYCPKLKENFNIDVLNFDFSHSITPQVSLNTYFIYCQLIFSITEVVHDRDPMSDCPIGPMNNGTIL